MAIKSSVDTTGYSATYSVQGREPWLSGRLFDRLTVDVGEQARSQEVNKQQAQEIFEVVVRRLERAANLIFKLVVLNSDLIYSRINYQIL